MARFKIVIKDPDLARRKEVERNVNARVARDIEAKRSRRERVNEFDVAAMTRTHRRQFEQKFQQRPAGTVHADAPSECPFGLCLECGFILHDFDDGVTCRECGTTNTKDGKCLVCAADVPSQDACDQCGSTNTAHRPNCRNCGDPEHAASCTAKGHCPDCGTKHGIAPDRIVAENGYELVEFTASDEAERGAAAVVRRSNRSPDEIAAEQEAAILERALKKAVTAGRMTQGQANAIRGHA